MSDIPSAIENPQFRVEESREKPTFPYPYIKDVNTVMPELRSIARTVNALAVGVWTLEQWAGSAKLSELDQDLQKIYPLFQEIRQLAVIDSVDTTKPFAAYSLDTYAVYLPEKFGKQMSKVTDAEKKKRRLAGMLKTDIQERAKKILEEKSFSEPDFSSTRHYELEDKADYQGLIETFDLISHDVGNHITKIKGPYDLVLRRRGKDPEEAKKPFMESMREDQKTMINTAFLSLKNSFAQVEAMVGNEHFEQVVTIEEIQQLAEREFGMHFDFKSQMPDWADHYFLKWFRMRAKILLPNIRTNTDKAYTDKGQLPSDKDRNPLYLKYELFTDDNGNEFVDMIFEDEGTGFPEEVLRDQFEGRVTKFKVGGTGSGLKGDKKHLKPYGGTLIAENRSEGGARLRVRLPANKFVREQAPIS